MTPDTGFAPAAGATLVDRAGATAGADLAARVTRLAHALAERRARRLALLADNGVDWLVADLAALQLGLPLVPLPAFFAPAQINHALQAAGVDTLLGPDDAVLAALGFDAPTAAPGTALRLGARKPAVVTDLPPGTAKITFTSGTTGTPKGVCLSAAQQRATADAVVAATVGLGIERHLCLLPLPVLLENVAGALAALRAGIECVVPPLAEVGLSGSSGFDPLRCLDAISHWQAGSVILLPQMLQALTLALQAGAPRPDCLRFAAVGGARVSPQLLLAARAAGLPAYEGYGLSEACSVVALNLPGADRPGSVGKPLPHVEVAVDAEGELRVRGSTFLGYLGEPPRAGNAWLATGDLGSVEADGYVHIDGRCKHVLITAFGRNVSPEWPEAELTGGAVVQAVVFGEARPALGAVLVARPGSDDAAIQAQVDAANGCLPDYARIAFWIRAPQPFSAANGLATPNGRARREAVLAGHRASIEAGYRSLQESFHALP